MGVKTSDGNSKDSSREQMKWMIACLAGVYHFYIQDHLGNNRVMAKQDGTPIQTNHYYPFGMSFAESTYPDKQPYKYNGKELDTENGLNWYDYVMRQMSPVIPRFTSPDPLAEKYYSISPYAYCGNNPINALDLQGDTITTTINTTVTNPDGTTRIQSDTYYYGKDTNGNYGFIGSDGKIYSGNDQFVNDLTASLNQLQTGGDAGKELVGDLMNSTRKVQIARGTTNRADPNGTYIKWNPNSGNGGIDTAGNETRPAYIGLGHEMAHIQDVWNGTSNNSTWVTTINGIPIPNADKYATHIENQLRSENGIPLRTHYGIDATTGVRMGLESTRIIKSGSRMSSHYLKPYILNGVLFYRPYVY